jgi:hypothetical protein
MVVALLRTPYRALARPLGSWLLRFLKAGDRANIVLAPAEQAAADNAGLGAILTIELTFPLDPLPNVLHAHVCLQCADCVSASQLLAD